MAPSCSNNRRSSLPSAGIGDLNPLKKRAEAGQGGERRTKEEEEKKGGRKEEDEEGRRGGRRREEEEGRANVITRHHIDFYFSCFMLYTCLPRCKPLGLEYLIVPRWDPKFR